MELNQIIELKIDSLTYEGNGTGIYTEDGKEQTVFVPYSCPGDIVEARIVEMEKYIQAELVKIISKSPDRIEAKCHYFGVCGSCDYLHVKYEKQLEEKKKVVEYMFKKNNLKFAILNNVVKSPEEFNYRIRSKFQGEIKNKLTLGFNKFHSHELVDIKKCPMVKEAINDIYLKFREEIENNIADYKKKKKNSEITNCKFEIEIFNQANTKEIVLIAHINQKYSDFFQEVLNCIKNKNMNVNGYKILNVFGKELYNSNEVKFAYKINSQNLEKTFKFDYCPESFTQVNLEQNEIIVNVIQNIVKKNEKILDLFCGIGNIGLSLDSSNRIVGIDGNSSSIKDAKNNAKINKKDAALINKPVDDAIKELIRKNEKFDVIIMDPPRDGAGDVVRQLFRLGAKKIIYLSCNPRSMTREIKYLQDSGYGIRQIIPFDMFPQTHHIEVLVELYKWNVL